jgi:hypothetical protein
MNCKEMMITKSAFYGFALLILLPLCALPASEAKVSQYLNTAYDDIAVKRQNERLSLIESSRAGLPFLDDVSFRVRNEAFNFGAQRYSLRLEPLGFGETMSRRKLLKTQQEYRRLRQRFTLNSVLLKRYEETIDFLEKQAELSLLKETQALCEDRVYVLGKLTGKPDFDLEKLIDSENSLTKATIDVIEQEKKLGYAVDRIQNLLCDTTFSGFDTAGIIGMDAIRLFTSGISDTVDSFNLYLRNEKLRFSVSKSEYMNDAAKERNFLDFVEVSFDTREYINEKSNMSEGDAYNLNKSWIIEAGFRIPGITTDRYDMARTRIRFAESEQDYRIMEQELILSMKKDAEDIRVLMEQYVFLQARENDVKAESSLKKYLEMDGVDPVRLLSIKESIIRNKMQKTNIRFSILRNYIRILDASGALSQEPVRNYLSAGRGLLSRSLDKTE